MRLGRGFPAAPIFLRGRQAPGPVTTQIAMDATLTLTAAMTNVMTAPRSLAAGLVMTPEMNRKLFLGLPVGLTLTPTISPNKLAGGAVTVRSKAGDNFTGTASPVATYPAGVTVGDILVTFFVSDTSHDSTGTPPTGWTKGPGTGEIDRGADSTLSWFWKRADGTESGTLTWTNIFAATETGRIVTIAFQGAYATGSPWSGTPGEAVSTAASAYDTPSATPADANCLAIAVFAGDTSANPALFTWDGGITEQIDSDTTPSGQNALLGYMTIATKQLSGSPATSMGGDFTTGTEALTELIMFLKPQPTGGPTTTQIPLAASLTLTAAMVRKLFQAPSATLTLTPAMTKIKTAPRALAATLTLTAAMSATKVKLQAMAASLALTAAMTRKQVLGITLPASLPLTAAMTKIKSAPRLLSASLTLTPTMGRVKTAPRQMDVALALSAALDRVAKHYLAMNVNMPLQPSMIRGRIFRVTVSANLTLAAALNFVKMLPVTPITLPVNLFLNPRLTTKVNRVVSYITSTAIARPIITAARMLKPRITGAHDPDDPTITGAK